MTFRHDDDRRETPRVCRLCRTDDCPAMLLVLCKRAYTMEEANESVLECGHRQHDRMHAGRRT